VNRSGASEAWRCVPSVVSRFSPEALPSPGGIAHDPEGASALKVFQTFTRLTAPRPRPRDTQIASSVAGIVYLIKKEKDEKVDKK
jgi:hypothetical protein